MARLLLTIFAALGLAMGPFAAPANVRDCGGNASWAGASDAAFRDRSIADQNSALIKPALCCEEMSKGCAEACATACATGLFIVPVISDVAIVQGQKAIRPLKAAPLHARALARLDRPPKSIT